MITNEILALLVILITCITSVFYIWITKRFKIPTDNRKISLVRNMFLLKKTAGLLIYGIIPALLLKFSIGFAFSDLILFKDTRKIFFAIVLSLIGILILLNLFNSRNQGIRGMYPEMRLSSWNMGSIFVSVTGWFIYLTGYEFLFRGILLTTCVDAFGPDIAIGINILLYFIFHLHKKFKEALATIPFGLVICLITLEAGSILPAIIIHSVQAISIEIACICRNNEMNFFFSKNSTQ